MALTKDQKKAQVADLVEKMKKSETVIFAHYIGLNVADLSAFRSGLRESEAEMKVGKKTLMKLAAKEVGLPELTDEVLEGPVACIFSYGDPLAGAQATHKLGKKFEHINIVGGIFEGKLLSKEEAMELAKMPSREVLLATFASMIRSPLTTFAGMCSSPLGGFARAVSELAEKGGANPEAAAPAEEKTEAPKEEEAKPAEEEQPAAEETAATDDASDAPAENADAEDTNSEPSDEGDEKKPEDEASS